MHLTLVSLITFDLQELFNGEFQDEIILRVKIVINNFYRAK